MAEMEISRRRGGEARDKHQLQICAPPSPRVNGSLTKQIYFLAQKLEGKGTTMAIANKAGPYDLDISRDMQIAKEKFGVGLTKQVGDFLALRSSGAGLNFEEYIYFRLFNQDRKDFAQYMGDHRARAAFFIANKLSCWDDAEDKLLFHDRIVAADLPTPQIFAAAHESREINGIEALRTIDDVRDFLQTCEFPIFGKPIIASHGDGSIGVIDRDGDTLIMDDGRKVPINEVADDIAPFLADAGFLFQACLAPHGLISTITEGRIATMRVMVWLGPDGPDFRDAVLRLPAGVNRVDNFRRKGNLISKVDLESGVLGPAHRGVGVHTEILNAHPDTGEAIKDIKLPDFAEAKFMVSRAAPLFPDLHIQSWDVAFTDRGPLLLEVNPGGNFNIIQLANGRGAYDPEFREFLEYCLSENTEAQSNAKALKEAKKLLNLG